MPLRLECPSCTAAVNAPDSLEGKKICCPKCAYSFTALSDAPPRSKPADRPPAGDGEEEVVDLPERREGAPIVPGLVGGGDGPPPPQPPPVMAPAGRARVMLSNGSVSRVGGRMQFRANYRFTEGGPVIGAVQ